MRLARSYRERFCARFRHPLRHLPWRGSAGGGDRALSRIVSDQRGGVFLEFTVVAPLLLFLCFGIVQYGLMLLVYNSMYDAARQGARVLAVSTADSATAEADAEAKAREVLTPVSWPDWCDDCVVATDGTDVVTVTVTVPAVEASIINVVPMAPNLVAKVVMRKE